MRKFVMFLLPLLFALFPSLAMSVDVGEEAPEFQGNSTQGVINLADYKGSKSVVLALYFAAFTPV